MDGIIQRSIKMAFYGDFTIDEAENIGQEFRVICKADYGYEGQLKIGKEYLIKIEPRILPMSPICSFTSDRGTIGKAHLERFSKITNEK